MSELKQEAWAGRFRTAEIQFQRVNSRELFITLGLSTHIHIYHTTYIPRSPRSQDLSKTMAKEPPAADSKGGQSHPKLPRLPKSMPINPSTNFTRPVPNYLSSPDSKIQKRPLLHPAIPSPRTSSSSPKIIYVSASSPFISVVKRVRKNLSAMQARLTGPINLRHPSKDVLQQVHEATRKGKRDGEEVILKGTGKAIQKVLTLAAWFQDEAQSDLGVKVVLRTSSVGAIDDVVRRDEEEGEDNVGAETRVRRVSCLEVGISLR